MRIGADGANLRADHTQDDVYHALRLIRVAIHLGKFNQCDHRLEAFQRNLFMFPLGIDLELQREVFDILLEHKRKHLQLLVLDRAHDLPETRRQLDVFGA